MNTTYLSAGLTDTQTIELLTGGDEAVFEKVFKTYFKALHAYAFTILRDDTIAEEMVQIVFMKIWEKKGHLALQTSLKAYLYRSVYNESMNYLKHQKVKLKYQVHTQHHMKQDTDNASHQMQHNELEDRLHKALNELPEGCRTIFQLSRFEELKYQEIADRLQISIKTVENQMGKALKTLRLKLIDFLPSLLFVLLVC
jgi:RNA polymerase sigma-70 factor (ECF subfamily)